MVFPSFSGKKKKKKGQNRRKPALPSCSSVLIPSCLCRQSKTWVYLVCETMFFMGLSFSCVRTNPWVAFTADTKKKHWELWIRDLAKFWSALALENSSGARWTVEEIRKAEKDCAAQFHVGLGSSTWNTFALLGDLQPDAISTSALDLPLLTSLQLPPFL